MKIVIQLLILFLAAGLYSCSGDDTPLNKVEPNLQKRKIIRQSLNMLTKTNPDSAAVRSIQQKHICFLGVMGDGLDVPGVEDYHQQFRNRIPIKMIAGTTDQITSEEVLNLNAKASKYALRYNAIVLQWVKKHR
jgi:hypothetical protein